jgi:hypothetical protein
MKSAWVKQIVKNITHEVSKELGIQIDVVIDIEFDWVIEFKLKGIGLLDRSLTVRNNGTYCGYFVSHGIHSPSETKSDLVQAIIVGKVGERLFYENFLK